MLRLVKMTENGKGRCYHFEDKEKKEAFNLTEEQIIAKSAQLNNSFFMDTMLGIAWDGELG